jgi:hypothetical protein
MKNSPWIWAIVSLITALVTLFTFLFSSKLIFQPTNTKPTSTPTTSSPSATSSAAGGLRFSGVLSVSGPAGVNLDTVPPTVGTTSSSTISVVATSQAANFQAELPSSLALVRTGQAPTLNACLVLISQQPILMASVPNGGWLCVRTAGGATGIIHITAIEPPIIVMDVATWSS